MLDPKSGLLAQEQLTDPEFENFLNLLREVKQTTLFDFLYYILKEETLLVLDTFAEQSIKLPSREETMKLLDYARIYTYCKAHESDPEVYRKASKKFQRRTQSIQRILAKAESLISKKGESTIWESPKD